MFVACICAQKLQNVPNLFLLITNDFEKNTYLTNLNIVIKTCSCLNIFYVEIINI
jgi:hypothetical protein